MTDQGKDFLSRRSILKAGFIFAAVWIANEVAAAIYRVLDMFDQGKVFRSLSGALNEAILGLVPEMAWILFMMAVCCTVVSIIWAWCLLILRQRLEPLMAGTRGAAPLFWMVGAFIFFSVLYFFHNGYFPYSRMRISPIGMGIGFVHPRRPLSGMAFYLALFTTPALLAIVGHAFIRERRLRYGVPAGLGVLVLVFSAYSWATSPGAPPKFEQHDNVIIVGVDSYQYNRMPMGGYGEDFSPTVNAFMEETFHFRNAWTPFARTYVAWLSALTGRYPVNHGVRVNLAHDSHLSESNKYLPELFRNHGYHTFHATDEVRFSVIRAKFGYDELFHPRMGVADFMITTFFDFTAINVMRQFALGHDLFPSTRYNRASSAFNWKLWTREFKRRINEMPKDKPLFIQFHLCGNHFPFSTRFPYAYVHKDLAVFDCMAMVDDMVEDILAHLEEAGLMDKSTVVMLSDHGDGSDGTPEDITNTHGDTFERIWSNMIILGFRGEGVEKGSSYDLVRLIDVYPTLLEMKGIEVPADIDGESLVPIMRGEKVPQRELYAETGFDKSTFSSRELIKTYASWYDFDRESGIIYIGEEGFRHVMDMKNYQVLSGSYRLYVNPKIRSFKIRRYDHSVADNLDIPDPIPDDVKKRLLRKMADHFKLDYGELIAGATYRKFIADDSEPPPLPGGAVE